MMAISFLGILILMLMLGAAASMLFLIIFAIQQKRFGLLALIGGLSMAVVLMLVLVTTFVFYARQDASRVEASRAFEQAQAPVWAGGPMNDAAVAAAAHTLQEFHVNIGEPSANHAPIAAAKMLLLGGLGIALAIVVFRRLTKPTAACGRRRIWPVLLVVPLLALFFLGSVRYETSSKVYDGGTVPMRQMTTPASPEQSAALANGFARMEAEAHQQIAHANIQELMDKADKPRIPLSPQPVAPAPTAVVPAAPIPAMPVAAQSIEKKSDASSAEEKDKTAKEAEKSPSKSTTNAAKSTAGSKSKNKKNSKPPANVDAKTAEAVAQSSTSSSSGDDKKSKEVEREKTTTLVEAMPGKTTNTRPAWIDQPPRRTRDNPREVIATDEYESLDECYQAGDVYLMLKTYQRIQLLAGRPYADGTLPNLSFRDHGVIVANGTVLSYGPSFPGWADPRLRALSDMGISAVYIHEKIVAKDPKNRNEACEYVETVDRTFGPMKKLYLQIEFSPAIDRELRAAWDTYQRNQRFWMFGTGATSVLGFLGFVFGLLKIDTWTKGYYSKRLFIGVPAAIIVGTFFVLLVAMK